MEEQAPEELYQRAPDQVGGEVTIADVPEDIGVDIIVLGTVGGGDGTGGGAIHIDLGIMLQFTGVEELV